MFRPPHRTVLAPFIRHGSSSLLFAEYKRKIIQGAINRGVSFSSITKFGSIFEALGKNVRPNMSFDEMIDIQKKYRAAVGSIVQLQMTGQGELRLMVFIIKFCPNLSLILPGKLLFKNPCPILLARVPQKKTVSSYFGKDKNNPGSGEFFEARAEML